METIYDENLENWHVGRAGMLYRDLTPVYLKPRVIVSHIRLPFDGEVPDYVHYHKVDFQMIYCKKGRIKVVYEDQGEPFWLEAGDCVLQPPEIRHRVLECEENSEVIEITSPASHETCVEHELTLPTNTLKPSREFNGQLFVRHVPKDRSEGTRDTGIRDATKGLCDVRIVRGGDGIDNKLLFQFSRLFAEGDGFLAAPISIEIPV